MWEEKNQKAKTRNISYERPHYISVLLAKGYNSFECLSFLIPKNKKNDKLFLLCYSTFYLENILPPLMNKKVHKK